MIFIVILSLKPATLGKRDDVHASHDQVVQQTDIHEFKCLFQMVSEQPVGMARFRIT